MICLPSVTPYVVPHRSGEMRTYIKQVEDNACYARLHTNNRSWKVHVLFVMVWCFHLERLSDEKWKEKEVESLFQSLPRNGGGRGKDTRLISR